MCSQLCKLYSLFFTLYFVLFCTLYSLTFICTLYSVHGTLNFVNCTLYSVLCTLYSVPCTYHFQFVLCTLFLLVLCPCTCYLTLYSVLGFCTYTLFSLYSTVTQSSQKFVHKISSHLLIDNLWKKRKKPAPNFLHHCTPENPIKTICIYFINTRWYLKKLL